MRRKLTLIAGGLAVGALIARLLRRRGGGRAQPARTAPSAAGDPRAAALRLELDRARRVAQDGPAAGEAPAPDDARRRVHERGRAAVERMRRAGADPSA